MWNGTKITADGFPDGSEKDISSLITLKQSLHKVNIFECQTVL